jgi:hypothetical protein
MLLSSNLALAQQPLGYDEGSYQQGYQQGYQLSQCEGSIYCAPNAAPAAPAPEAGMNNYEAGIYQGIEDQKYNELNDPFSDRNVQARPYDED